MDLPGTKIITNKVRVIIWIKLSQPIKMWGITYLLKSYWLKGLLINWFHLPLPLQIHIQRHEWDCNYKRKYYQDGHIRLFLYGRKAQQPLLKYPIDNQWRRTKFMAGFHIRYYKFKVSFKIFLIDLSIDIQFLQGHNLKKPHILYIYIYDEKHVLKA